MARVPNEYLKRSARVLDPQEEVVSSSTKTNVTSTPKKREDKEDKGEDGKKESEDTETEHLDQLDIDLAKSDPNIKVTVSMKRMLVIIILIMAVGLEFISHYIEPSEYLRVWYLILLNSQLFLLSLTPIIVFWNISSWLVKVATIAFSVTQLINLVALSATSSAQSYLGLVNDVLLYSILIVLSIRAIQLLNKQD